MNCFCDYDAPTLYRVAQPVARKPHRCSECGATIHAGERYESVVGLWDSRWDHFRTCTRCTDLRDFVKAHVPCMCWAHGHIREDAIEAAREYASEAPGLLFGALRREVIIRRGGMAA